MSRLLLFGSLGRRGIGVMSCRLCTRSGVFGCFDWRWGGWSDSFFDCKRYPFLYLEGEGGLVLGGRSFLGEYINTGRF